MVPFNLFYFCQLHFPAAYRLEFHGEHPLSGLLAHDGGHADITPPFKHRRTPRMKSHQACSVRYSKRREKTCKCSEDQRSCDARTFLPPSPDLFVHGYQLSLLLCYHRVVLYLCIPFPPVNLPPSHSHCPQTCLLPPIPSHHGRRRMVDSQSRGSRRAKHLRLPPPPVDGVTAKACKTRGPPPPSSLSPGPELDCTCGCCWPREENRVLGEGSSPPRRRATCTRTWGTVCPRPRPPSTRRRRRPSTSPGGLGAEPASVCCG